MNIHKQVLLFGMLLLVLSCKQINRNKLHNDSKVANKLVNESSPYLLQHAYNPVQWHPWGEEALFKAKAENKMMIISVGYSACHWCHVMEHESFEDSTVAKIMNDNFVCIKVDREERPDVDDVYMTACHLSSGRSCGWPLNAFALADGRPVWAGTYFPKDQWTKILNQFIKIKTTDEAQLLESADKITEGIQNYEALNINTSELSFTNKEMDGISKTFLSFIDFKKGGRKTAPKFPMPNNYEFLLKYHHLSDNSKALDAVTTTLDKMALGGIYDQLGGGFARYSTDDVWLAPHFEKMLYDNGQLISLYAHAYQKTKNPLYEKVVRETIAFANRELLDPAGGYYASLDADSEGVEGKFYVWAKSEIDSIIGDEREAKIFNKYFDVQKSGNWEHTNILNVKNPPSKILKEFDLTQNDLDQIIKTNKDKLFKHRGTRIRPGLDDKVLTAWNGLMLTGLVDAYMSFGDPSYLDNALATAKFILEKQRASDGRLNRNFKDGKSSINGFLDDYSSTIQAFIKIYQATFDEIWLREAEALTDYTVAHFLKKENGMFNFTSDLDPPLVVRKSEIGDNVIPGSNSMMADNLFTLGLLLDRKDYKETSKQMLKNVLPQILSSGQPHFYSNWCKVYLDQVKPPYEVAIIGADAEKLRQDFSKNYIANALILGGTSEGSLSLLKEKLQDRSTMIYVCQNKVCKFPVEDVDKALKLMN